MVTNNDQPVKSSPRGAPGPADYAAAGFRILPIDRATKRPLVEADSFGREHPTATCPPEQFQPGDGVALLCGPTPRWAATDEWLAVVDIDGEDSVESLERFVGLALPATVTSKGQRHLYFRVPPSELRAALRQWAPLFGRKLDGAPKVDLKWSGGYAIEPAGAWDAPRGWDPDRIAVLPSAWIQRVLELRNQKPAGPPRIPQGAPAVLAEMGDVPQDVVSALAAVWPSAEPKGQGCHTAALALGGILADSHWSKDDMARFAGALFIAAGVSNRVSHVLYSVDQRRDTTNNVYGWTELRKVLEQCERGKVAGKKTVSAALATLKTNVPGLSAPRPYIPEQTDDGKRPAPKGLVSGLSKGSDVEVAECIVKAHRDADGVTGQGLVYDEGAFWAFEPAAGVWKEVPRFELSREVDTYDGKVYDYTDKGRPIWLKLGAGRTSSILSKMADQCEQPRFFSEAPVGLAFQNGFLRLTGAGRREFEPLAPEHRARHVLPCEYGPDAARAAPPIHWVRYLRSIWGDDHQSIRLVHQMLGYLLSGRHDLQKIFVLLGPPRAGKGTLLNLIQAIFQDQATSFKVASLDQTFSMQSMLGKSVAYDPDVRRASSMFKSEGQMVERLLSLSSHDVQVIPRKNQTDVVAALPCRLLLAANPPFGLSDAGGALASRFIILTFPRSFLGREDTQLGARLEREIPAIVALALDGLDQLDEAGRFVEPDSSAEERESVERAQNPMVAFLDECCDLTDSKAQTARTVIWAAAVRWREDNGHRRMSGQAFSEFLRQRGVKELRPTDPEDNKKKLPRVYQGIKLLSKDPVVVGVKKDNDAK